MTYQSVISVPHTFVDMNREKKKLEHDMCTFQEIVEDTEKAPSTVSTHLKRLKEANIVSVRRGDYFHLYKIAKGELVAEVLSKYVPSFVDKVVDNYTEMLEEL